MWKIKNLEEKEVISPLGLGSSFGHFGDKNTQI